MLAYTLRRVAISIPVLIASTFVVFLFSSLSGDPLEPLKVRNPPVPPATIAAEAHRLHLDQPLLVRYFGWLGGLLHGDFGPSVSTTLQIGPELGNRLLITFRLIALAMIIALILAIVVGVLTAVRQYSAVDYTATFFGFLFLSMPAFWFAILLKQAGIWINNATGTQTFYTIGDKSVYVTGGVGAHILDILGHMILPTISLALISYASWSRFQRASMLEVLNSDYIRLARAKGLSRGVVMRRHALRTALIPLTTVTALDIGAIIGGAVLTETVFQWHGMGDLAITAIRTNDTYLLLGWLLVSAAFVILFNLIADLLYAVLDPRIRYD
jgi:glutathione transport system permease protein